MQIKLSFGIHLYEHLYFLIKFLLTYPLIDCLMILWPNWMGTDCLKSTSKVGTDCLKSTTKVGTDCLKSAKVCTEKVGTDKKQ